MRNASDTKAAILAAARTRFAAEGYRSASIRAVARDVGVDAALVVRYFGSKPALSAAATDISSASPTSPPRLPANTGSASSSTSSPAGTRGRRRARYS
jgi:hypothetical protein